MEDDRIIYKITVADLQEGMSGHLGRRLTDEEVLFLEKELPDCVSWSGMACNVLVCNDLYSEK